MQQREAIKKLRATFWVQIATTAAIATLFETGLIAKGLITLTPTTRYIAEVAGIMLTIALIPLAIKGFSTQMQKAAKEKTPLFIDFFYKKSSARINILFFVTAANLVLHYGTNNAGALYCALLGAAALIYSYPAKNTLRGYTQENNAEQQ